MMTLSNREPRLLGLLWIKCPYPTMSLGLESLLGDAAVVYRGQEAPPTRPSAVILHPDGEDVGKQIKLISKAAPEAPTLVFGLSADLKLARLAIRSGARGFIHAEMQPRQIIKAISLALNGEVVVPREFLQELVSGGKPRDLSALRPRQREILDLLAEGMTNSEIAGRLYLSESTVKQHLRRAYKTLEVKNRAEATRLIHNQG